MLLNSGDMRLDPGDFAAERRDPRVQLVDRDRVEVLLDKLSQRIARLGRKEVVQIHRRPALTHGGAKSISGPLRNGALGASR